MQPSSSHSTVAPRPTQSDIGSRPTQPGSATSPGSFERKNGPRPDPSQPAAPQPSTSPSGHSAERPVEFELKMPQAKSALLAGSFNNWDPRRTPMRKDPSGGWKATVPLRPGRYEYRFVADGQWITDPNAREGVQNPFGTTNSVVLVTG